MKRNRTLLTLATATALAWAMPLWAQNAFDVKAIYIVPQDKLNQADAHAASNLLNKAKETLRSEMSEHGFGDFKTFRVGADTRSIQTEWKAQHFERASQNQLYGWVKAFVDGGGPADYQRIYLFLIEGVRSIGPHAAGTGFWFDHPGWRELHKFAGGYAFVALDSTYPDKSLVIAHELCHVFGLDHNPEPDTLMYGGGGRLSSALDPSESKWLNGTRYFTHNQANIDDHAGIHWVRSSVYKQRGELFVELEFHISSHVGARMFQVASLSGWLRLAMIEMEEWETKAVVTIPQPQMLAVEQLACSVLDAEGGVSWDVIPLNMPPTPYLEPNLENVQTNSDASTATSWAALKTRRH